MSAQRSPETVRGDRAGTVTTVETNAGGHCCGGGPAIEVPKGTRRLALVGNPNVGKSLFFNAFTGLYVDVSNYPGTTVSIASGRMDDYLVQDTPGVYGVSSFNDEEKVARDVILDADVVVNVVDAVHLERDLFLTQQLIDMGVPMVLALNMTDEAEKRGMRVDAEALSRELGVPVVPTVAISRTGFDHVKAAVEEARPGNSDPILRDRLQELLDRVGTIREALLVLEGDPYIAERHGIEPQGMRDEMYTARRQRVNGILPAVVERRGETLDLRTRLGHALVRPLTGIPLLALTLFAMYEFIGVFVAQTVVGVTEEAIMAGRVEPVIRAGAETVLGSGTILYELVAGEFGVLTMTLTYVLGLLLPLVVGFYLMLSVLEDSGYLPRIAALTDRTMTSIGLNGRAIIPMILGFGCVTMAAITTRILGSDRERKIATALMAFAIPCSAQLGVIIALLAVAGGPQMALAYGAIMFVVFGLLGVALARFLPGSSTSLLLDLPPLRIPRPMNVLSKTYYKTVGFLREVTVYFAAGALFIGVLQVTGALVAAQNAVAPLVEGWLNLPKEAATAFIMGFVRRDFGAAGLYDLGLTGPAILVSLVTITLFVPCIASILVIMKERGRGFMAFTWLGSVAIAFTVGGVVAQLARIL